MTITMPRPDVATISIEALEPDHEIVARARGLRDLIREHAAEGDRGTVPSVVTDELERLDLFRLTVPKRYGGLEVNQRTFTEVLSALGEGDGSTAWTAMLINIGNWFATTWPQRAQDEIWGDQRGQTCVVLSPTGNAVRADDGTLRVTGAWPYASGSYVATHAMMGVFVEQEDGSKRPGLAILQPGEWSIERSWYPLGLCGTGSDTVVANDVAVPSHRIQYYDELYEGHYGTEHQGTEARANAAFLATGTIIFGAVLLGLGKAAFELAVDRMTQKGIPGTMYKVCADSPYHQVIVAKAAGLIDQAELLVHRASRDIDEWALRGEHMDLATRARVRHDTGAVVELITEAVDLLMKGVGSSSFLDGNPLQRIFRDVSTGGSHVHATPGMARDIYGKVLLGSVAEADLPAHC